MSKGKSPRNVLWVLLLEWLLDEGGDGVGVKVNLRVDD